MYGSIVSPMFLEVERGAETDRKRARREKAHLGNAICALSSGTKCQIQGKGGNRAAIAEVPQTGWLKPQKWSLSMFRRPDVPHRGVSGAVLVLNLCRRSCPSLSLAALVAPAILGPWQRRFHLCFSDITSPSPPCLCVFCSFHKDTSRWVWGRA